jgi:hypothetical protein
MPYSRSFNNGVLCSAQLAKVVEALMNDHVMAVDESYSYSSHVYEVDPIEHYKNYVQSLMLHENFIAEAKNLGVNTLETSSYLSQKTASSTGTLFVTPRGLSYKNRMQSKDPFREPTTSHSIFSWMGGFFSQFVPASSKDEEEKEEKEEKIGYQV